MQTCKNYSKETVEENNINVYLSNVNLENDTWYFRLLVPLSESLISWTGFQTYLQKMEMFSINWMDVSTVNTIDGYMYFDSIYENWFYVLLILKWNFYHFRCRIQKCFLYLPFKAWNSSFEGKTVLWKFKEIEFIMLFHAVFMYQLLYLWVEVICWKSLIHDLCLK